MNGGKYMKYILETQSPEINIRWTRPAHGQYTMAIFAPTLADQSSEPILRSESP
jgi:hypothetical protein